jgi:hypothetical protein
MHDRKSTTQFTRAFFLLVFVLSLPFWRVDSVAWQFLRNKIPVDLPVSSLQAVNPLLAALILVYVEDGSEGVRGLLKRAFDYRRIRSKAWYVPALCLWPAAMLLEYGLLYLTGGLLYLAATPLAFGSYWGFWPSRRCCRF